MELDNSKDYTVVFITTGSYGEAEKIAKSLVENNLVACVNIIQNVRSIYRWEGDVCESDEALMIIKTREGLFTKLEEHVKKLHSYSVPEIVAIKIISGSKNYLDWIDSICK